MINMTLEISIMNDWESPLYKTFFLLLVQKFIYNYLYHIDSVVCIRNVLDDILISGCLDGLIKKRKIESDECINTISSNTSTVVKIVLISNDIFVTCSYVWKQLRLIQ